jgi:hypothetical protein
MKLLLSIVLVLSSMMSRENVPLNSVYNGRIHRGYITGMVSITGMKLLLAIVLVLSSMMSHEVK